MMQLNFELTEFGQMKFPYFNPRWIDDLYELQVLIDEEIIKMVEV